MAIFYAHVASISRNKGQSVAAAAAYITGEEVHSTDDGKSKKYGREERIFASGVMLPEGAPDEWDDIESLVAAIEASSDKSNARLGRNWTIALPREMTKDENIELAARIADNFRRQGMCIIYGIHDLDTGNPHMHMLTTARRLGLDGQWVQKSKIAYLLRNESGDEIYACAEDVEAKRKEGYQKVYRYYDPVKDPKKRNKVLMTYSEKMANHPDWKSTTRKAAAVNKTIDLTEWDSKTQTKKWKKEIEDELNATLEWKENMLTQETGREVKLDRVDSRSYKERGLDKLGFRPQEHEGPIARRKASEGEKVDVIERNEQVRESNGRLLEMIMKAIELFNEGRRMIDERLKRYRKRIHEIAERIRFGRGTGGDSGLDRYSPLGKQAIEKYRADAAKYYDHAARYNREAGEASERIAREDGFLTAAQKKLSELADERRRAEQELKAAKMELGMTYTERDKHIASIKKDIDKENLAFSKIFQGIKADEGLGIFKREERKEARVKILRMARRQLNEIGSGVKLATWKDLVRRKDIVKNELDDFIASRRDDIEKVKESASDEEIKRKRVIAEKNAALEEANSNITEEIAALARENPAATGALIDLKVNGKYVAGCDIRSLDDARKQLSNTSREILEERPFIATGDKKWSSSKEYASIHVLHDKGKERREEQHEH